MSGADSRPQGARGEQVGLCATCLHARRARNERGSQFWQCERAREDPRYRRYPPLPVTRCPGHEASSDSEDADPNL